MIAPELQPKLWAYIGGITRFRNMKALAVGGIDDHVHLLLSLPATIPLAKAVQQIKAGSSKWIHDECKIADFEWQQGYGAFSVGVSQVNDTIAYINNQQEHHRKHDFRAEFVAFLKRHNIDYDPRYVVE